MVSNPGIQGTKGTEVKESESKGFLIQILDFAGKARVPHWWFTHFYALSFSIQVFWFLQIFTHGRILQYMITTFGSTEGTPNLPQQSIESILISVICMMAQSGRRLYESVYVQKSGQSTMGIMIYVAGILFYTAMGFTTWCHGLGKFMYMYISLAPKLDADLYRNFKVSWSIAITETIRLLA